MRFWVYGVDGTSKTPRDPLFLEADSAEATRAQALEFGMQAEEVEPVQPRPGSERGRSTSKRGTDGYCC